LLHALTGVNLKARAARARRSMSSVCSRALAVGTSPDGIGGTPFRYTGVRCRAVAGSVAPILGHVRVYLCRHAQAASGEPDALRELAPEGLEQARELGERLAALPEPPVLVLTSPLTRARQTGAEIARAAGIPARVEEALAPGATADAVAGALAAVDGPVATVGHQPDCSEIALAVLGHDPGFPVAGMAELELGA
jgi:phosphohistidine phosphatase SixA